MSKLIQIRQRIKAIETIKKITHAMRLISMSAHSRMKHKVAPLALYQETVGATIQQLHAQCIRAESPWHHPTFHPSSDTSTHLIILLGAQKGLCGAFEINLFKLFDQHMKQHTDQQYQFITIGKKAEEHVKTTLKRTPLLSEHTLSSAVLEQRARTITQLIVNAPTPYRTVSVVSNSMKSFFVQLPMLTPLIPFGTLPEGGSVLFPLSAAHLNEHSASEILTLLATMYLETQLHYLLFQSLLAEHAARFISMDSSTRNATALLDETKASYNKLRQAQITKELSELIGSFTQ